MTGVRLRDVTAGDLSALHPLNEANVPAVSPLTRDQFKWFLQHADYIRLAEIDGAVAGFLLALRPGSGYTSPNYTWFESRYDDFLYIDRLAVDVPWRRRGVASALYADVERRAQALGVPLLACEVNLRPRNEGSLAFHARHGFAEAGQQETEGGSKRVSMLIKPLAAAAGGGPAGPGGT